MKKPVCKYLAPAGDFSGYGEASRNYICALDSVGVNVVTEICSYSNNKENFFGESYRLAKNLEGQAVPYDIKIVHVPCDAYLRYMEPCKYHIGHLFWETDRMSPEWVWNCNLMDEIWTGSEFNKQAFERSGVTKPIKVFPQAIDVGLAEEAYTPWKVPKFKGFLFYSIFQWIERKNPRALVKAYLNEFDARDSVGLLIKSYKDKFTEKERKDIIEEIWKWREELDKKDFPPIFLNTELMEKEDVFRIHSTGDCFVLPHYGEGWGLPIAEAVLFGKPAIATNRGGVHNWLTKECYYPLTFKEVNVSNMEFAPWYKTDQMWAEVDVSELQAKMRYVFEHRKEAKETGQRGQGFVKANFSFEAVGRMLKDRLIDIQKSLK